MGTFCSHRVSWNTRSHVQVCTLTRKQAYVHEMLMCMHTNTHTYTHTHTHTTHSHTHTYTHTHTHTYIHTLTCSHTYTYIHTHTYKHTHTHTRRHTHTLTDTHTHTKMHTEVYHRLLCLSFHSFTQGWSSLSASLHVLKPQQVLIPMVINCDPSRSATVQKAMPYSPQNPPKKQLISASSS